MHTLRTPLLTSVVLAVMFLVTNGFPFRDAIRIKVKRGSSSATARGTVAQGGPDFYVVRARAGQIMTVRVRGTVTFGIDSPRGRMTEDDGNTSWSAALDLDGDYTIRVYSPRGVQKYALTVSIL